MLKQIFTPSWKIIFYILVLIILVFAKSNVPWHKKYITSDGFGYYGYLPAVFIYGDLKFGFIDTAQKKEYENSIGAADFRREVPGGIVNICYAGTSILWLPFFIGSHIYAHLSSYEPNGFSYPYQVGILFAGIFYLALGLWVLGRILKKLSLSDFSISVTLIALVLATPALYYSTVEPSFSHIYSFTLICIFLLVTINFLEKFQISLLILIAAISALIGIMRPTNGILLAFLIPICLPANFTFRSIVEWLTDKPLIRIGLPVVVFILIIGIQPIIYLLQTGKPLVWSYQGGSFNFSNPQIINILFSYKKGLFIYTPILLFAIPGLFALIKSLPFKGLFITLYLFVNVYMLASWWSWWFGMSLGHRAFIDFYALWFIPVAYGVDRFGKFYRHFFVYTALICIIFFQILTKQYIQYVLYWDMNKEMFWRVFLHTSRPYHGLFWQTEKFSAGINRISTNFPVEVYSFTDDFEDNTSRTFVKSGYANSGFYSCAIPKGEKLIIEQTVDIQTEIRPFALLTQGSFYLYQNQKSTNATIKVEIIRDDVAIHVFEKDSYKSNSFIYQWNRLSILTEINDVLKPDDRIRVTVANNGNKPFHFDDFEIIIRSKDVQQ